VFILRVKCVDTYFSLFFLKIKKKTCCCGEEKGARANKNAIFEIDQDTFVHRRWIKTDKLCGKKGAKQEISARCKEKEGINTALPPHPQTRRPDASHGYVAPRVALVKKWHGI
jgi:hypothetical protein